MPIEEELEEIQVETSVQDTQTDQKKESDEERNWKAFLEKRKEETKALEEEREKNKQLELERENYKKRIEEMKEAFKALLEKKEPNPYEYGNEEDPKKALQEEVERLFREQEQKEKIKKGKKEHTKRRLRLRKRCQISWKYVLKKTSPILNITILKLRSLLEKCQMDLRKQNWLIRPSKNT